MARGRNNNKMTRREPAVMQMNIVIPAGISYVDLNLCASLLNRRAYKQQNTSWAVAQFEMLSSGTGEVVVGKLPETWVMENAYKKSRALWDKMNDQVLDTEPGIEGKYHDFKIYMDEDMTAESIQDSGNSNGRILTPLVSGNFTAADLNAAVAPIADWDWSILTIPNDPASGTTSEYTMHAVGADALNSKSLIAGYELSRARPASIDPNVPTAQGWMNDLFDDGEQLEELRDNLDTQNDRAPYPVGAETGASAFYPGGPNEYVGVQVHSFCSFTNTTVSGKNTIQGGMFNLGLIKFDNQTDSAVNTIIHLMPGKHRGYLVEEMC